MKFYEIGPSAFTLRLQVTECWKEIQSKKKEVIPKRDTEYFPYFLKKTEYI